MKRVLSGWSVSPYRPSRLSSTSRTRLASWWFLKVITKSSANRTKVQTPARRGFTTLSNQSSSTWCRKMFDSIGEMTPMLSNIRSEEHTCELQSHSDLVCRLLLEKKKKTTKDI